jgi:anti-anti-sigma factor
MDAPPVACLFDQPHPGWERVRIAGELDASSADGIEEQIKRRLAPGSGKLVVDLEELGFIDSTGIRLVLQMARGKNRDEEMVIVSPRSRCARRALEVVGLTRIFRVVESLDDAL